MNTYTLSTPLDNEDVLPVMIGDRVLLQGVVYTARDAAHQRFITALDRGHELPFSPQGAVIYYVGPSPAPPGRVIGSAGPTSSYRMDCFAPRLYQLGIKATIGKGRRNSEVIQALRNSTSLYLVAIGGAGALLAQHIVKSEIIAYEDLGPEAVRRLEVRDFPLIVAGDAHGGDIYNVSIEHSLTR
jgi:fumarate hydratase subunit beta